jgi:hypothetical protein
MKRFELLPRLIIKAKRSGFWLNALNLLMARTILFSTPNDFKIIEIGGEKDQDLRPVTKK